MNTDTIIQIRPQMPGDDVVYTQTPTPAGLVTQEINAEDSWDLAEEQAKQAQENDLAAAGIDDDSSSTSISTISGTSNNSSDDSSDDSSSDTSTISASASASAASAPAVIAGSAATTSAASTAGTARTSNARTSNTTSTAASGANRMTTAVPASTDLRARIRASVRTYHICACISSVLIGTGVVFTLLAKELIPHRDSGYVYPEETEFDKVMAGIWYGAGAIAGGIGIANAVYHCRSGNC